MLSILISKYLMGAFSLNGTILGFLALIILDCMCLKSSVERIFISFTVVICYLGLLIISSPFYFVTWFFMLGPVILGISACFILYRRVKVNLAGQITPQFTASFNHNIDANESEHGGFMKLEGVTV